jgi:hypothetical protein
MGSRDEIRGLHGSMQGVRRGGGKELQQLKGCQQASSESNSSFFTSLQEEGKEKN